MYSRNSGVDAFIVIDCFAYGALKTFLSLQNLLIEFCLSSRWLWSGTRITEFQRGNNQEVC